MQVRELMTSDPACCTSATKLDEVAQLMVQHDCGAIPIIEDEASKKPLGIVTDRDITTRSVALSDNPLQTQAGQIMTETMVTVQSDADTQDAERLMQENQVRRLLVMDDQDRLTGIVAQADLAQSAAEDEVGSTVARISEPSDAASEPSRREREQAPSPQ